MWTGPTQKYDVALLFHVMYHLGTGFMKKCFDWLNPQGHMIVALSRKEESLVQRTGD